MAPNLFYVEAWETVAIADKQQTISLQNSLVGDQEASSLVLAQVFDQDVVGDLGNAINTFVESGQIWALIIGFILGYMLRSVTTYK